MKKPSRFSSADFYDRQWEQRHFQNLLSSGHNVLITAPRRVGKTELAYALLDWATDSEWLTTYGNIEHGQSEADFFNELVDALTKAGIQPGMLDQFGNTVTELRKHLPSSATWSDGEQSIEVAMNPEAEDALVRAQKRLEQLFRTLTEQGREVLIALDELPIFLSTLATHPNGEARVAALLHWFRKLRTDPGLRRVRWLLCGSIGLDTFVEQRGMAGSINDLRPEKLGPFEQPIALEFVKFRARRTVEQIELPDEAAEEIVRLVGWPLPFYLRLMVDELTALPPSVRSDPFPTSVDIANAYKVLISPDKKVQFVHWVKRLDLQFGKVAGQTAHAILKECCQKPVGTTTARLRTLLIKRTPGSDPDALDRQLADIVGILERDGYLHHVDNRWAFRSFLLRDFWSRHVTL